MFYMTDLEGNDDQDPMQFISTYNSILESSEGDALFVQEMLLNFPYLVDWKTARQQQLIKDANVKDDTKHIDHDRC